MNSIINSQKSPLVRNNDPVEKKHQQNSILKVPELSSEQIRRNAAILYKGIKGSITADNQGNLIRRSFLVTALCVSLEDSRFARVFDLSEPDTAKVCETILATLEGIKKMELPSNNWTFCFNPGQFFSIETFRFIPGETFNVGYDKLAVWMLVKAYNFNNKHSTVLKAIDHVASDILETALQNA